MITDYALIFNFLSTKNRAQKMKKTKYKLHVENKKTSPKEGLITVKNFEH